MVRAAVGAGLDGEAERVREAEASGVAVLILGIDPGKRGAIVAIASPTAVGCVVMPTLKVAAGKTKAGKARFREQYDLQAIRENLSSGGVKPDHAFLEAARPFPMKFKRARPVGANGEQSGDAEVATSGVVANWNRGYSLGLFEGLFVALGIPYTLVAPQSWQHAMHAGTPGYSDTKTRSVVAAQRLFPTVSLSATSRSRLPHDGIAEALLIAEYGRRLLAGGKGKQLGLLDPELGGAA